jgi:aspartate/methionine/tyrosine aminotransferase
MRYSPLVDRISGEGAAAWEIHFAALAAKSNGADVIVMSVGDPDLATPASIVETAVDALRAGDTHYTEIPGRPALREAIARNHAAGGGADAGSGNVVVFAGAQNALFAASLCLFSPGDEVLVLEPMYVTYEATFGASGASIVRVGPAPDSGFRPDLDAIAGAVGPRTRGILFATPNNPTGVVMTETELSGIAEIATRHDLWVISDEVYAALTFGRTHVSIAGIPGMRERTVTVGSLSKSMAMTGWRCGWLIGPEALARHAERLALCMLYGQPGFIQQAALHALLEGGDEIARMREIYRSRRDLVHAAFSDIPELSMAKPEAGMFALLDVRRSGLTASEFAWTLLREQGVAVLEATPFGRSAAGYVRISYALDEATLAEGCERIRRFVEGTRRDRRRASA